MTPISDDAFVIMSICPEAKKHYGITVDHMGSNKYKFVWAFKIDKDKAHREGYDSKRVHGSIELDDNYPGCPYCKAKQYVFCNCGSVICWNGEEVIKCPTCGASGEVSSVETVDLSGGTL